ncbi:MAG: hypothetical protein IKD04_04635 [Clostridia bacterium]|nr:hypothetical protein [Clostridia bacterium]
MLNSDYLTNEVGFSEYIDSKNRSHTIKHSIILADYEKRELEDRIAEDLYRIFAKKASV